MLKIKRRRGQIFPLQRKRKCGHTTLIHNGDGIHVCANKDCKMVIKRQVRIGNGKVASEVTKQDLIERYLGF